MSKRIKKPVPATDPNQVLLALLGWWDHITEEINRVSGLMRSFRSHDAAGFPGEYPPGFEFADEAGSDLACVVESFDRCRPAAPQFTTDELIDRVRTLKGGAP